VLIQSIILPNKLISINNICGMQTTPSYFLPKQRFIGFGSATEKPHQRSTDNEYIEETKVNGQVHI